ncbi:terminase large subunit [Achromobacter sp. MFA1 R4]|uniref:terminase large subunit n=1 Tax=Achromobacter sp. MFA1 R4 TaxID=1881016 RepID=UPI000953991D|nr:terminase TerL endonuclease subunit [Achromobacter sp. MFA1 R4]SIT27999.1 Phage terminase-like protein, large subunit, contains N-terminal HTH domain [Achromobacter sp. MFA1 R4]
MATAKKKTPLTSSLADRTKEYAEAVVAGVIVAGPHVRNSCKRHLLDLEKGGERGLYFDHAAAEYAFDFFEGVLKLSEGQFEGKDFELHPSQAFIVGSLFGWKRADGTRRFRRAYIEQGKGNGKSPLAGGIGLLGLTADGEAGAQIYAAAAKKEQAGILFADAVKMVKASPSLKKRLEFSGGEGREYNIAYHRNSSFFRPVSRDTGKTGSGPRPYFVLADEVHELPDRKIIEMLERGFKFRRQPLLFMITNSGSDRNSVAWEEHEHAVKVAAGHTEAVNDPVFVGEALDDNTFSYVCALDEGDDPLTDPTCWVKANPLLGVTITETYLADVVAQAKSIPGQLNGILRLHFCIWTDAETAWMTRATLDPALVEFDPKVHAGEQVWIGLDLSQNRDITALAAVTQTGVNAQNKPLFDAWIEAWTPGDTIAARELRDKIPYTVWKQQGFIHAPPGESINYRHVAQTLAEYAERYDVQLVAYDRFAFKRFEEDVAEIGLSLEFIEHPQGGLKKGKPNEAMVEAAKANQETPEGLWMPGSVRLLEDALLEGRIRLRKNPVLISAMMSAVTEEDKWGNHWLAKTRSINKIDAAVALAMAIGAASTGVLKQKTYSVFFV